jgi:hypothetical protein
VFLRSHFNDLLVIPCLLPLLLWLHRCLLLRSHDSFPSALEVALHLVVWSVCFELIGPLLLHWGTADPIDVIAYWIGGVGSWIIWQRCSSRRIAVNIVRPRELLRRNEPNLGA